MMGFEPTNNGFADHPLKPLGYIVTGAKGLEPLPSVLETVMLPLTPYTYINYQLNCFLEWTRQDLNLQRLELHPNALPIELPVLK